MAPLPNVIELFLHLTTAKILYVKYMRARKIPSISFSNSVTNQIDEKHAHEESDDYRYIQLYSTCGSEWRGGRLLIDKYETHTPFPSDSSDTAPICPDSSPVHWCSDGQDTR